MHCPQPPHRPQWCSHGCRTPQGLTAVELLTTLSILGLLAGLAAPSFGRMMDRWQVQQTVDGLQSTLYFARSEAIKRGGRVGIQKTANLTEGCTLAKTNQEWGCGWFVFEDLNSDGKWQKTEAMLHRVAAPGRVAVIHQSGGTGIRVDRFGKMSGLNAKGFTVSPAQEGLSSPATRGLCMASGGRIRITSEVPCQ